MIKISDQILLEKHILSDILRSFSKKEFSAFEKFVISPYHNEGRNHKSFVKELKRFHPTFAGKNFTREKMFSRIYPGKKYNPALMDTLISRTSKLAEKFLLYSSMEKYKFENTFILMREAMYRNLGKTWSKKQDSAQTLINSLSPFDFDFFENITKLETLKTDYAIARKDYYKSPETLIKRNDYLLLSMVYKFIYSLEDLYNTHYEVNANLTGNIVIEASKLISLGGLVELIIKSGDPHAYVISFKYKELAAITKLDYESFLDYKNAAFDLLPRLTWEEKANVFGNLSSICNMASRKTPGIFEGERLNVYKKMIDENNYAYSREEYSELSRFYNLATDFADNAEWEYFDKLIKNFGVRINPMYKESFINYSYMYRYFRAGDFEKALSYNAGIDYNHSLLRFKARILLMKVYYELNYIEEVLHLIDSSIKFYENITTYSEEVIMRTITLMKYLRRLIHLKESRDTEKLRALKDAAVSDSVSDKPWLLKKIQGEIK